MYFLSYTALLTSDLAQQIKVPFLVMPTETDEMNSWEEEVKSNPRGGELISSTEKYRCTFHGFTGARGLFCVFGEKCLVFSFLFARCVTR